MAAGTGIEWTDATWNPMIMKCIFVMIKRMARFLRVSPTSVPRDRRVFQRRTPPSARLTRRDIVNRAAYGPVVFNGSSST
jgi:hypothetical protein